MKKRKNQSTMILGTLSMFLFTPPGQQSFLFFLGGGHFIRAWNKETAIGQFSEMHITENSDGKNQRSLSFA